MICYLEYYTLRYINLKGEPYNNDQVVSFSYVFIYLLILTILKPVFYTSTLNFRVIFIAFLVLFCTISISITTREVLVPTLDFVSLFTLFQSIRIISISLINVSIVLFAEYLGSSMMKK